MILIYFSRFPDIRKSQTRESYTRAGRCYCTYTVNLIFLESFSPSVCSMQMVCACTVNLGHSGHVRLATQVQINRMVYHWSLRCSPDSSDLMLMCALEQKHTQFCAETWKCSLALLRQERVCDRKQTKGRQVQSYTRTGRRNRNLMLGSVLSKRTARASEERIGITEFCLWTKAWTVIKPGYSWLQRGILSH